MTNDRRTSGRFLSLWRDTRGITALMFGLLALPLIIATGVAVDVGIAYYLKSRLAFAVDAAALAVGSTTDDTVDLQERAEKFFKANYPDSAIGEAQGVTASVSGDVITVSASASFDTFFLRVVQQDTVTVSAKSQVIRSVKGLEVALVLDNTGSMRSHDNIGTLRIAAEDMMDILFGGPTVPDAPPEDPDAPLQTHDHLYVSIVPYAASVNPGPEAFDGSTTPSAPAWWPASDDPGYVAFEHTTEGGQGWKGCVVERPGSDMMSDDSTTGWTPYAWEPEVSNNYDIANMANTIRYDPSRYQNQSTGPNLGCPSPIIPLINEKETLVWYIRKLDAWNRGGTLSDIGMAWGRRVLSPQAPFTEGKPYNEDGWKKAIVLMTDGQNLFYKLTRDGNPNRENDEVNSDYTGYERVEASNPLIGTDSTNTARNAVNNRLKQLCQDLKDEGVEIYTVTFTSNIDSNTRKIYKDCASDPTKWFNSPTKEDLKASFKAIGMELSNLRVAR